MSTQQIRGNTQIISNTVDAATLNGYHASDFAPVSKGVTNGDSHDHLGGDGGSIASAMGNEINLASSKNPPVNGDSVAGYDSVGLGFVRFTMANIRSFFKTTYDAAYAAIANGVTNGDSHDHNGGDGATIAYSSLSGRPVAETNTNDIFLCSSPGGVSAFVGTINGAPAGASVTYNVTSGQEGAMVPASTSQLAKMRLYNTTRGNSALISNCNTTTNVITLTANAPANWANGDTITIASQTTSGGGFSWVDLEITSGPTGKSYMFVKTQITSATANDSLRIHPFTASFSASKLDNLFAQVANQATPGFALIVITNNVFSVTWVGSPTSVVIREAGYLE